MCLVLTELARWLILCSWLECEYIALAMRLFVTSQSQESGQDMKFRDSTNRAKTFCRLIDFD